MSNSDGFSRELQNPILCISLSEKYNKTPVTSSLPA
jgi:hypothetical protein